MHHIKNSITYGLFACLVMLLSSCGVKYYDLVKTETPQAPDQPNIREVATRYVKSQTVYNQFETMAIFDVLWLSDEVRKTYVDVYSNKHGLTEDARDSMLKRNLEENNHWVTFYVLADVRDKTHPMLSDRDAAWSLYLTTEGAATQATENAATPEAKPAEQQAAMPAATPIATPLASAATKIEPELIKEVELESEYQLFFGRGRFVPSKAAYIVKFPAAQVLAVQNPVAKVTLVVGSVYKQITFVWDNEHTKKNTKKVLSDEDFYWG